MAATPAAEAVTLPSLDHDPAGQPWALPGHWFPAPAGQATGGAVVLLHGCGGALNPRGGLTQRLRAYSSRLNSLGLGALVLDSLSPRGESEICTQRYSGRRVTVAQRAQDAQAALQWLAAQPGLDAQRLGLIGWSNGGSTVLAAGDARSAGPVKPAFLVAFYPGCEAALKAGFRPVAPLLLLLGGADDWTPPQPCQALARPARGEAPAVEAETFDGAFHGFDGEPPVRLRRDVPNGVHPGQGVHVGGDPAAREAALARLDQFIRVQAAAQRQSAPSSGASR